MSWVPFQRQLHVHCIRWYSKKKNYISHLLLYDKWETYIWWLLSWLASHCPFTIVLLIPSYLPNPPLLVQKTFSTQFLTPSFNVIFYCSIYFLSVSTAHPKCLVNSILLWITGFKELKSKSINKKCFIMKI